MSGSDAFCGRGNMQLLRRLLTLILLQASFPGSRSQSWSVWMPSSIWALKDSCVVIPCTFTYPKSYKTSRNFSIAWYLYKKKGYPEVYNSRGSQSVESEFQGRTAFVGDMGNRNCSLQIDKVRHGDEDNYYPIINKDNYKFWDFAAHVKVSDKPDEVLLSYPKIMSEGESVIINCSAKHTCPSHPPSLTWDRFGDKTSVHYEELGEGRWKTVSMLSYSPAAEDHGKHLQCVATYPNKQQSQKSITFNIRYSPKGVHLIALGKDQIHEGDSLVLRCESKSSNPAVAHYTWYKDGDQIVNQSQEILEIQSVTAQDAGEYHCAAHNALGSTSSRPLTIKITDSLLDTRWNSEVIYFVGSAIILSALGGVLFIWLRKRKCPAVPAPALVRCAQPEAVIKNHLEDPFNNTYTALNLQTRCSEYKVLQVMAAKKEGQEDRRGDLEKSSMTHLYEEVHWK